MATDTTDRFLALKKQQAELTQQLARFEGQKSSLQGQIEQVKADLDKEIEEGMDYEAFITKCETALATLKGKFDTLSQQATDLLKGMES